MRFRNKPKTNSFLDIIKSADIFTKQIQFTIDKGGETDFKTDIGGAWSIVLFIIIFSYAL